MSKVPNVSETTADADDEESALTAYVLNAVADAEVKRGRVEPLGVFT